MPTRVPPPDVSGPVPISPIAHPVDTFVTPGGPLPQQNNNLLQLAQGLSSLEPGLQRLVDVEQQRAGERQNAAGTTYAQNMAPEQVQAALKNKADFKTAVSTGAIPAGASPWFYNGYKQQLMKQQGLSYSQALMQDWQKSDIRNSDDPQAFQQYVQQFTHGYFENSQWKQDPMFGSVVGPQVEAAQHNLSAVHTSYRQQQIEEGYKNTLYANIGSALDNPLIYASKDHQIADIQAQANQAVANGMSGTAVNTIMAKAFADKAYENLDPSVIEMGRSVSTGNGNLGSIEAARELFDHSEMKIFNKQYVAQNRQLAVEEKERRELTEHANSTIYSKILQDPHLDLDHDADFQQLLSVNATAAHTMKDYQEAAIRGQGTQEDPQASLALQARSYAGKADTGEVLEAFNRSQITRKTADELMAAIPKAKEFGDPRKVPEVGAIFSYQKNKFIKDPFNIGTDEAIKAESADLALTKFIQNYDSTDKDNDPGKRLDAIKKYSDSLVVALGGGEEAQKKQAEVDKAIQSITPQKTAETDPEDSLRKMAAEYDAAPTEEAKANTALSKEAVKLGIFPEDLFASRLKKLQSDKLKKKQGK